MPQTRAARTRGHQIEVTVADDGTPAVTVDGEDVPVGVVDGRYAVAYLEPVDDLLDAAKQYTRLLD